MSTMAHLLTISGLQRIGVGGLQQVNARNTTQRLGGMVRITSPFQRKVAHYHKSIRTFSSDAQHSSQRPTLSAPPPGTTESGVRALAGRIAIGLSVAATLGALFLVEESDQAGKLEDLPNVPSNSMRYNSSGGGGKLQVGAYSLGEEISKEELSNRYEYLAPSTDKLRRKRKQVQVVGRGAFGRVIRALDKSTGEPVAMKIVSNTAMSAESLLREVEVLRRVRGHDHIIHLKDTFGCNNEWYVVTELCEGGELLDRLIQHGPYDEESAATLIERCASAIRHIHSCGYVHLDIKPENLVFAEDKTASLAEQAADCRIIDFGMAKELSDVKGNLKMVGTGDGNGVSGKKGTRLGTLAYWSVEQLRSVLGADGKGLKEGEKDYVDSDPRACDMWALGAIMYIVLLGAHPFDPRGFGSERDMSQAALAGKYTFDIHGKKLQISDDAKDLIRHLLDPNPETRYTPEQVLNHPWIKKQNNLHHEASLPYSWSTTGYDRPNETDALFEKPEVDERYQPYLDQNTVDAFFEAVLIASTANATTALKEYEEEQKSSSGVSNVVKYFTRGTIGSFQQSPNAKEKLFKSAFHLIDEKQSGVVRLRDVDSFVKSIGDVGGSDAFRRKFSNKHGKDAEDPGITLKEFVAVLRKNKCVTRKFKAGENVFKQGAEPQGFYVLLSGEARVMVTRTKDGKEETRDYAKLRPGNVFGETALLQGAKVRSATIQCLTPAEVLYIPKDEFLKAMARCPALNTSLFQVVREQQAKRVHELVESLHPPSLRKLSFPRGTLLFKQNDKAKYMYLIKDGIVGVSVMSQSSTGKGAQDMAVRVAERRPGDITGMSAIHNGHRTTTAQCLTPVEALVIDHEDLDHLLATEPIFQFYIQSLQRLRKEAWQDKITDMERGVSEPQLFAMLKDQGEEAFEEFRLAMQDLEHKSFGPGDTVIRKGGKPESFYIIDSGIAVVEYMSPTGEVMQVAQLGPGDHFGEQAILENRQAYVSSVRCVTPMEVQVMDKSKFLRLIGAKDTVFAQAVTNAMRERQHRWVRNLLSLAKANESMQGTDQPTGKKASKHDTKELIGAGPNVQVSRLLVRKGNMIFEQGGPADAVYYVHRGEVQLLSKGGDEDDLFHVERVLGPGDTIGLECFADGAQQKYTAVCASPRAVLSKIPRETLDMLIRQNQYVSEQLHRHIRKTGPKTELELRSKGFLSRYLSVGGSTPPKAG